METKKKEEEDDKGEDCANQIDEKARKKEKMNLVTMPEFTMDSPWKD